MRSDSLRLLTALLAVLVLGLSACSDDETTTTTPTPTVDGTAAITTAGDTYFTAYTRPDGGPVNITAQTLYDTMVGKGPSSEYFVVDWRSSTHFANGHIEGAVNLSLATMLDNLDQFPTDRVILNVCYTGQTASTATAILNMLGQEMGFNAANLKFGMHGWTWQGNGDLLGGTPNYPMEDDWVPRFETTDNPKPTAGTLPTWDTSATTNLDALLERARLYVTGELNGLGSGWNRISDDALWDELFVDGNAGDWFILNYFPPTNYDAGHIPGAVRYQPKADLQSTTFLNTLPQGQKIAVYCWTGQTSAQVTAYLNMLGYEAYSLLFGVQDLCYNEVEINDHAFQGITDPGDAYPVVTD